MRVFKFVLAVILVGHTAPVIGETYVTTYVTRVQEERRSTRWTLTEWLRIKERMKLMDVWLAMFSSPKTDKFQPELNLMYFQSRGALEYAAENAAESDAGTVDGYQARAQLWLTNVFTGSTGLRLLNVDFGLEGRNRFAGTYEPDTDIQYVKSRKLQSDYYTANFRIFGKNIQDSSLILKAGQYHHRNTVPNLSGENSYQRRRGFVLGGELQLYLFRWLGLEGNYSSFQPSEGDNAEWRAEGRYYDYMAYVEVSLLRLVVGQYREDWLYRLDSAAVKTDETGLFSGVKLQL